MMTRFGFVAALHVLIYVQGTFSLFYQSTEQQNRCLQGITNSQLINLTVVMADMTRFYQHFLPRVMLPRIPDTTTHAVVREFIRNEMKGMGWTVELDHFNDSTPYGPKGFTNIVATLNPRASKRIVFACHYDSKILDGPEDFLAATDSAVPCAILLDTAWKMERLLQYPLSMMLTGQDVTPQFIFFDGEEAFDRWTATDSLYGSRHLANKWFNGVDPNDDMAVNNLENIDLFVLLDLIGASNMRFVDFFSNTTMDFYKLYQIEYCLKTSDVIRTRNYREWFFDLWDRGQTSNIQDDHIPFIQKGVRVLHLISSPFPGVWHTPQDDLEHLDQDVIKEFSSIFRVFFFFKFMGGRNLGYEL